MRRPARATALLDGRSNRRNRRGRVFARAVHLLFEEDAILFDIFEDLILYGPFEKVELSDGGAYTTRVFRSEPEHDPFSASKGVELYFFEGLQLRTVVHVDVEITFALVLCENDVI